jgi:photosystem II stability/assembly factor-like uncharacterized protein
MNSRHFCRGISLALMLCMSVGLVFGQGDFWQSLTGPDGGNVMGLVRNAGNEIFALTDFTIFKSTDGGSSWNRTLLSTSDLNSIVVNPLGELFAGSATSSVFRSNDGGNTWMQVNNGLAEPSVRSLAVSPEGHILAGTSSSKIFWSTNSGDDWTEIATGLSTSRITAIATKPTGTLFAGTSGAKIFRSPKIDLSLERWYC